MLTQREPEGIRTPRVGLELLREFVVAASHAADGEQLRFGREHSEHARGQVAARVQAHQDRVLALGTRGF